MKRFVMAVSVVFAVSSLGLAVQKKNSVTTNPFSLLLSIINAEGNFSLSENFSVTPGFSYFKLTSGDWDYKALGLNVGLRYYWEKKAVNRWYVGPILGFVSAKAKYDNDFWGSGEGSASAISYGGLVGYQSIWDSGFTFDCGFGASLFTIPDVKVDVNGIEQSSGDYSVTLPILKLSIGYAF